jgi:hypothetical protein
MCRAIDAAFEVDEVTPIRDKALALEFAARIAKNIDAEQKACEIRLRAERKAGELLAQMEKANGKRIDLVERGDQVSRPTLRDLGITKDQSSDWQKLAKVPQDEFEAALADKTTKPSTNGIIRANAEPKPQSCERRGAVAVGPAPRLRAQRDAGVTWTCCCPASGV